jgi:TfoX/Sxy family transcriptional regulator of competence genes
VATRQSTIDFLLDQLSGLSGISTRKMFGEYAVYYEEKVVALVCDDQFFAKVTEKGRAFLGKDYEDAPAYPGAKPSLLVGASVLEDHERLRELVMLTARELPAPKPKKPRTARKKATR